MLTRFLCIFLFEGKFEFVQFGFGVSTMLARCLRLFPSHLSLLTLCCAAPLSPVQVPLCSGSGKCQLQALFFLFLGHPPLDFRRKIGRDATVLKFSFSLSRSAHKVFVYIPL